jgi:hypothetical protein
MDRAFSGLPGGTWQITTLWSSPTDATAVPAIGAKQTARTPITVAQLAVRTFMPNLLSRPLNQGYIKKGVGLYPLTGYRRRTGIAHGLTP